MSFIENLEKIALRTHMRREMRNAKRRHQKEAEKAYSTFLADQMMFDTAYYALKSDGKIFSEDDKRRPLLELLQFLIDNSDTILEILLRLLPYIITGEGSQLAMQEVPEEEPEVIAEEEDE